MGVKGIPSEEVVGTPTVVARDKDGNPAPQLPRAARESDLRKFKVEDFLLSTAETPEVVFLCNGPFHGKMMPDPGQTHSVRDVIVPDDRRAELGGCARAEYQDMGLRLTICAADASFDGKQKWMTPVHSARVFRWVRNH